MEAQRDQVDNNQDMDGQAQRVKLTSERFTSCLQAQSEGGEHLRDEILQQLCNDGQLVDKC